MAASLSDRWRWADPQGVQRVLQGDELRSALASGTLPPYTLVWQPGMADWLPAYDVPQLATVALSVQQGIIPNIPPPPMSVVAVQAEFEHRTATFEPPNVQAPPPPIHLYAQLAKVSAKTTASAFSSRSPKIAPARKNESPRAPAVAPAVADAPTTAEAPATDASLPTTETPRVPAGVTAPQSALAAIPVAPGPSASATAPADAPASPDARESTGGAPKPSIESPRPPRVASPLASDSRPALPPRPLGSGGERGREDSWLDPLEIEEAPAIGTTGRLTMRGLPEPAFLATRPPLARVSTRPPPPPPPRKSRAPALPSGPAQAMPRLPLPPLPIAAHQAPIIVPAPQAYPPAAITQSPPFGATGKMEPLPPAPLLPHLVQPDPARVTLALYEPSTNATMGPPHAPTDAHFDPPAFPVPPPFASPRAQLDTGDLEADEPGVVPVPTALTDPREQAAPNAKLARDGESSPAMPESGVVGSQWESVTKTLARVGRASSLAWSRGYREVRHYTRPLVSQLGRRSRRLMRDRPAIFWGAVGGGGMLLLVLLIAMLRSGPDTSTGSDATESSAAVDSSATPTPRGQKPSAAVSSVGSAGPPLSAPSAITGPESQPSLSGAAAKPCSVSQEAVRLAARAEKNVPVEIRVADAGDKAWIGFASDPNTAQGLVVDLATFKAKPTLSRRMPGKVHAVTPLDGAKDGGFVVSAEDKAAKIRDWHPLSAAPPSVVGNTDGSIVFASDAKDEPQTVWALDADAPVESLRTVDAGSNGYAVVFRRAGAIQAGWLGTDGTGKGELAKIAGALGGVGSPQGGTNGRELALVYAGRASSDEPWQVHLAHAPVGSIPKAARPFPIPAGGPGGASIAPAIAGLTDGRWVLVWTEGATDHAVRGQTLAPDFTLVGEPFTMSAAGVNAGQGAAAVAGGTGIVAFLTAAPKGFELWAATLVCP